MFTISCLYHQQDTLVKVKGVICDEKKHIRFSDWSSHDVSIYSLHTFKIDLTLSSMSRLFNIISD